MIYFDKPTQLAVLRRMVPLLAADGMFFAGHSESFFHAGDLIRSVGRTIYKRADAIASGPVSARTATSLPPRIARQPGDDGADSRLRGNVASS
jgi:hypothetical protein